MSAGPARLVAAALIVVALGGEAENAAMGAVDTPGFASRKRP